MATESFIDCTFDFVHGADVDESLRAAVRDQVRDAANQPPPAATDDVNRNAPEALFHFLNKTLLLKHLRELKAEVERLFYVLH